MLLFLEQTGVKPFEEVRGGRLVGASEVFNGQM